MFSAALVMALLSANAQKRAFTIEDLYKVKGVYSVSLSPDGKTICYTSSSSDLKNQKSSSDIYLMPRLSPRMAKAVLPCGVRMERVSFSLIMRRGRLRSIA